MDKKQLRKELKSLRNRLSKAEVTAKSASICQKITAGSIYRDAQVVMAYLAFGNEVNIDAVITDVLQKGKTVCVPFITGPHTMQAVQLKAWADVAVGAYGIRTAAQDAPVITPQDIDLVLVPGLGFDLSGGRIGMGAGFYDRFLKDCRNAVKTGITYDILLREKIICDEHDEKIDFLITESQAAKCR